jgi:hypothetical protein
MNRLIPAWAAAAVLLAACGGGSGGSAESLQQVEDRSASATVAGLLGFAKAQIAQATSETAEPRPIDGITPPTSDADEPQPL